MKKLFVLSIFALTLVSAPVFAGESREGCTAGSSSSYLQTTNSWNTSNGNSFGNVVQHGSPFSFTSNTSAGMLFNQSNTAATSSLRGGSAWSKSTQDIKGGSDANFTVNLGNNQRGDISVASGHDFSAGIGNSSLVQNGRSGGRGTADVTQFGDGQQTFNANGLTSGNGTVQVSAASFQAFTGTATANTSAAPRSYGAVGTASQTSESGLSVGLSVATNGPGSANGSFGSNQNTSITQILGLSGVTSTGRRH